MNPQATVFHIPASRRRFLKSMTAVSAAEIDQASAGLRMLDKNQDGKLAEGELRPDFGGRGGPPGGGQRPQ